MRDQILDIKNLFHSGVDRHIFFKMILHCTDHYIEKPQGWANYLKLDKWQELYAKKPSPNLDLSPEQLLLFFNYMSRYHHQYIVRNHDVYCVYKNFDGELRTEENFKVESIIYQTLEVV